MYIISSLYTQNYSELICKFMCISLLELRTITAFMLPEKIFVKWKFISYVEIIILLCLRWCHLKGILWTLDVTLNSALSLLFGLNCVLFLKYWWKDKIIQKTGVHYFILIHIQFRISPNIQKLIIHKRKFSFISF